MADSENNNKQQQVINKLQKELKDTIQKLNDVTANLAAMTAQQKKTASLLDAEMKMTAMLQKLAEDGEGRTKGLEDQVEEVKKLLEESVEKNAKLLTVSKNKTNVENAALLIGGMSIPAGLILASTVSQSSGMAASTAGAATFLTAAVLKMVPSCCEKNVKKAKQNDSKPAEPNDKEP